MYIASDESSTAMQKNLKQRLAVLEKMTSLGGKCFSAYPGANSPRSKIRLMY